MLHPAVFSHGFERKTSRELLSLMSVVYDETGARLRSMNGYAHFSAQ